MLLLNQGWTLPPLSDGNLSADVATVEPPEHIEVDLAHPRLLFALVDAEIDDAHTHVLPDGALLELPRLVRIANSAMLCVVQREGRVLTLNLNLR